MANFKSWVLTDAASGVYEESWSISNSDLGISAPAPWSVKKRRLRGGLSDGVDLIEVDNGKMSYAVCPTRGMGIWRGRCSGADLGWKSPVQGPVNPAYVNPDAHGGIGWIAGFDEWIVRCGLSFNGAPGVDVIKDNQGNEHKSTLTLHGHIANIPAHRVEVRVNQDPPHEIVVCGEVDESMLFFPQLRLSTEISTKPGARSFQIDDEVINLRSQPAELELLYHCNFGEPLLGKGAKLLAPIRMVAPRDVTAELGIAHYADYPSPTPGVTELVYFMQLLADSADRTLTILRNPDGDKACALRFNIGQLPWFTLWKNPGALSDGYVTGLEPGTDLPNCKSFERQCDRLKTLEPQGRYRTSLEVEFAETKAQVAELFEEVSRLQSSVTATVFHRPQDKYSP